MKTKNQNLLLIGTISVILGMVISLQFRTVQEDFLEGSNPLIRAQELNAAYSRLVSQRDELLTEIAALEAQLKSIEENASNESVIIRNLNEELQRYKLMGGFLDVEGPGIQMILDNPVDEDILKEDINIIYEYDLINLLVNELNAAGAEAVEINDQRIIATTEIRTAGNSVSINQLPQYPPFVIKAIGNPDTLDGAVSQIFGIVSTMRDQGYFVEIKKAEKISIKKYQGVIGFDFAQPVK
ncbi:MAG: hypothetical protein AVO33_02685 [delta proteobacterium ML8_F1]|nr:MAG: hypothetical protein AVO33_02685 [delta proteobacterium ML8_F1]